MARGQRNDGTRAGAASATTEAGTPSMASITSAAAGEGDDADSITLVWEAPNSGGSDITGYQLRVWDGSNWMPLASPAAGATTYKHDNLAPGTRYYYTLAARNSMGLGPWSDAMSANDRSRRSGRSGADRSRHRRRLDPAHLDGSRQQRFHHHAYELVRWDPDANNDPAAGIPGAPLQSARAGRYYCD